MEKKKIPVALMIAAGMLLYNNTIAAQSLPPTQETSQHQLSFNEALQLLHKGNQSLKIADKGIDIARTERGKLNAFWMPSLQSTGAFVHLSGEDRSEATAFSIHRSGQRLRTFHLAGR